MLLSDLWDGSVESYLVRAEALGFEESSIVWQFNNLATELYAGDSVGAINRQQMYGDEELDLYAVGGVVVLDIYSCSSERMEYNEDIRSTKKRLYLT